MLFTGLTFICLFFPITLTVYWLLPQRIKPRAFLVFSILFLLISDPFSAAGMFVLTWLTAAYGKMNGRLRKKPTIFFLLTLCLLLLYVGGFIVWSVYLHRLLGQAKDFLRFCPFGAAFFVLQGIQYVVDIVTKKIPGQQGMFQTAEYLLFYPRLAMGPIQSYEAHTAMCRNAVLCSQNIGDGLGCFVRGLAKKVLLADTIGLIFSDLYETGQDSMSVVMTWITLLAFALQLYFTVAGYGDMARGIALCYGFRLPDDHSYPLFSGSLAAMGEQWNQSVVTWFRGFFAPMLRTAQKWQFILGTVCAWMLIGCWYHPCIRMLLWGIWMGFWIGLDQYLKKRVRHIPAFLEILVFILVTFCGWAVFSSPSFTDAVRCMGRMFGSSGSILQDQDLYFIQSGGMILLIAMYSATGHFDSSFRRIQQMPRISKVIRFLTPLVQMILLLICFSVLIVQKSVTVLL